MKTTKEVFALVKELADKVSEPNAWYPHKNQKDVILDGNGMLSWLCNQGIDCEWMKENVRLMDLARVRFTQNWGALASWEYKDDEWHKNVIWIIDNLEELLINQELFEKNHNKDDVEIKYEDLTHFREYISISEEENKMIIGHLNNEIKNDDKIGSVLLEKDLEYKDSMRGKLSFLKTENGFEFIFRLIENDKCVLEKKFDKELFKMYNNVSYNGTRYDFKIEVIEYPF